MMKNLLLCLLLYANLATCYKHKSPYSMLGLFSISSCESRSNFNCSLIPTNEKIIRETTKRNEALLDIEFNMCNVDIGTNRDRLIGIFLDLILSQKTKQTCLGRTGLRTLRSKSTFVYMYTTHELTVLASSIALPYDIIIIAVTFEPIISNYPLYNHGLFFYSYEASFVVELQGNRIAAINTIRKELNVTYGATINVFLQNQNIVPYMCTGRETNAFCVYTSLSSEDGCWKEKSINVLDNVAFNQLVNAIEDDQRLSFIIIYGNNDALAAFDAKLLHINREIKEKWFVVPFAKTFGGKSTFNATSPGMMRCYGHSYFLHIYDVPGAINLNKVFHFMHHLYWHMFREKDFYNTIKSLDLTKFKILFQNNSLTNVSWDRWRSHWRSGDKSQNKEILFKTFAYNRKLIAGWLNILKGRVYLDRVKTKELITQETFNPTKALQSKPYCHLTKPTCQRGKELKHSYFQAKFWDASYGWFCQQCPVNFYKSTIGNTACIPCPKDTRSDAENLFCYNPYKDNILSFDESITFICLSTACIIKLVLAIAVFFIFVKFRKTPLVRASNFLLSIIQISTHALLSVMLIFIFMGKPSREICIIRPLLIGVCFTLSTTINLGKTQKILMIFQIDLRMSRKEVAVIKASEILTILITIILDVGIFGINIRGQLPDVETTYDEIILIREYYCNNNIAVLIQFAVIFLIVIFNVIQGIRSRNLPSYFRESTYVLYSSFTSCVIFVAAIGIYSVQENEHRRTILLFAVCVTLNMLHFLLMYSYKVFVVIFRPEKNTKRAFDEKRMKKEVVNLQ